VLTCADVFIGTHSAEQGAVGPGQPGVWVAAAQDGHFVAQQEKLDVLGPVRPGKQHELAEHPAQEQLCKSKHHDGDHALQALIWISLPRTQPINVPGHGAWHGSRRSQAWRWW
jgi:hypothetical protein